MNQTTHDYWSFPSTLSRNGRNHIAVSARSCQCLRPHNLPSLMNHGSVRFERTGITTTDWAGEYCWTSHWKILRVSILVQSVIKSDRIGESNRSIKMLEGLMSLCLMFFL
jgi:hypothetical protein